MCGAFFHAHTGYVVLSLREWRHTALLFLNFAETHMVGIKYDHCFSIVFKWLQAAQIYPPYKCKASRGGAPAIFTLQK